MTIEPEQRTRVKEYAIDNFKNGLNCAEAVFDALIRSEALSIAAETRSMCIGFGGGIGMSGFTCGALSAAVMANGAVYGRPNPWAIDRETRQHEISDKHYRRYNRMVHDFEAANGGVLCRDICQPYESWQSKERRKNCMLLIGETAALAYDYLNLPQEEAFALRYGANMGDLE